MSVHVADRHLRLAELTALLDRVERRLDNLRRMAPGISVPFEPEKYSRFVPGSER